MACKHHSDFKPQKVDKDLEISDRLKDLNHETKGCCLSTWAKFLPLINALMLLVLALVVTKQFLELRDIKDELVTLKKACVDHENTNIRNPLFKSEVKEDLRDNFFERIKRSAHQHKIRHRRRKCKCRGKTGKRGTRGKRGPKGDTGFADMQIEAVHYQGNVDGLFKYWKEADGYPPQSFASMSQGNITILKDGLYFVYTQVMFYSPGTENTIGIFVTKPGDAKKSAKPFACCTQSLSYVNASLTRSKYHTCYIAVAMTLRKNDTVYLKDLNFNQKRSANLNKSFFGLIKLRGFSDNIL